jgi:hypothetical protein
MEKVGRPITADRIRLHTYGPEFPQRGSDLRDQAENGADYLLVGIFGAVELTEPKSRVP